MLSYAQRAALCQNPTAIKLLKLMAVKQTNLALSLDVVHRKDLLHLADKLGPEICILKTHVDILEDFDYQVAETLVKLAHKHNFIIFEDRKFADIGSTVKLQYAKGVYRIAQWAAITTAHMVPGPSIIQGLKEVGVPKGNGLLLLAEMSTRGALATGAYTQQTLQMALEHKDFVIGFITQRKLTRDPTFIHMTPGVQIASTGDALGQQYISPWQAVYEQRADVIIVGRGIYSNADPATAAKIYREQGWTAYLQRLALPEQL